jgi:hypothetical protein
VKAQLYKAQDNIRNVTVTDGEAEPQGGRSTKSTGLSLYIELPNADRKAPAAGEEGAAQQGPPRGLPAQPH